MNVENNDVKTVYSDVCEGIFLERPNRFTAIVEIDGKNEVCHVKNTGRCKELLIKGVRVYLQKAKNPDRKTKFDLISVYKGDKLINIDSMVPNKVFEKWLKMGGYGSEAFNIKREVTVGKSRLDFSFEAGGKKVFAEVKGVTLENNGIALFPDAPTLRGIKHIEELCRLRSEGNEALIAFVIQIEGISSFKPNYETHREFGLALEKAAALGVKILAFNCKVDKDSISPAESAVIKLS